MKRFLTLFLLFALTASSSTFADTYGKESGLLGPVTVAPKLSIGAPVPIRLGIETKYLNLFGLSFDYGFLPTIPYQSLSFSTAGWNISARYFLFGRALFLGVAFGNQTIDFSQAQTVATQSVTATAVYKQTFLAPHIGWRWTWDSGMFFGMEAGYQIPLSFTASVSTNRPDLVGSPGYSDLENLVYDKIDEYGSLGLPYFSLIQFGWYL